MSKIDPHELALRQYERDRERAARVVDLWPTKRTRMTSSPLAFFRGSAPLFFELLSEDKWLAEGPAGAGWIAGDLHLENFGAYRPERGSRAELEGGVHAYAVNKRGQLTAVFELNDFDEAFIGPWSIDVVRLAASMILVGRQFGSSGLRSLELCARLIDAYAHRSFRGAIDDLAIPDPVRMLVERSGARKQRALLEHRTEIVRKKRRFKRSKGYLELPSEWMAKLPGAIARYTKGVAEKMRPTAAQMEIVDATFRVAGNGSLGALRLAVLVRGNSASDDGEGNGAWVLDIKEEGAPAGAAWGTTPHVPPAARVEMATRACVASVPKRLGTTTMGGKSMLVRRLSPQEDRLVLSDLRDQDLNGLCDYLGQLSAAAHQRGATEPPKKPWTKAEKRDLLERAVRIASIHEAAYLSYCTIVRAHMR